MAFEMLFALAFMELMLTASFGSPDVVELTKKYTIRLPMITTLTGQIPFGNFCIKPTELLLSKVNAQKEVLPDYNVVVEYFDDNCDEAKTTRQAIAIYDQMREQHLFSFPDGTISPLIGDVPLPGNVSIRQDSARTAFTAPLMAGPVCSAGCLSISKVLQHYNTYSVVGICNENKLSNTKLYPNLFQYIPTSLEYTHTRIAVIKQLGWTKIGIISDTSGFLFSDVQYFMQKLTEGNIEVVAEEFYIHDIDRSVDRLMKSSVRVIFGLCYVPSCPRLGCSIAKKGFYGKNIVWIFPTYYPQGSSRGLDGCSDESLAALDESSLYIGIDLYGVSTPTVSEIGISRSDILTYLNKTMSVAELRSPERLFAYPCFQAIHAAIYVLDSAEKALQKENLTLRNFIGTGADQWKKLGTYIRSAGINLNVTGVIGPSRFVPGTRTGYAPWTIVLQTTRGNRLPVASFDHSHSKLLIWRQFTWRTEDGNPPKSWPDTVIDRLTIPDWAVYLVKIVFALGIVFLIVASCFTVKFRNHEKIKDSIVPITLITKLGLVLLMAAILIYPHDQSGHDSLLSMSIFCKVAPCLIVIGYSCFMGGSVVKVLTRFSSKKRGNVSRFPTTEKRAIAALFIWILANLGLYMALVFTSRNASFSQEFTRHLDEHLEFWQKKDLRIEKWLKCQVPDKFMIGIVLVVFQVLFGLVGIVVALASKYQREHLVISDFRVCLIVIVLAFPIGILHIFPLFIINTFATDFAITLTFGLSNAAVLVASYASFLFTTRITIDKQHPMLHTHKSGKSPRVSRPASSRTLKK